MRILLAVALIGLGASTQAGAETLAPDNPAQRIDFAGAAASGFGEKVTSGFRVRATVVASTASPLDDPDGHLRRRFASSMFDYYPKDGQGFHLSAGMRYFSVQNSGRDAEKTTHGLLYNPRSLGNSGTTRAGFKRQTPAVTMGYTKLIGEALLFGIEGGTLLGRINATDPTAAINSRRIDRSSGLNPVANLVFGFRF